MFTRKVVEAVMDNRELYRIVAAKEPFKSWLELPVEVEKEIKLTLPKVPQPAWRPPG
jgi:hypothetical protein